MGYASSIYENPANKLAYIHFDELHFRITKNSGGFRPTTVADKFAYFFSNIIFNSHFELRGSLNALLPQ